MYCNTPKIKNNIMSALVVISVINERYTKQHIHSIIILKSAQFLFMNNS